VDADGRRNNRPLIVVCDLFGSRSDVAAWPHVRPLLDAQEWGVRIGRLLLRQVQGDTSLPDHELVPVELVLPRSSP
jgi:hypothetical protein